VDASIVDRSSQLAQGTVTPAFWKLEEKSQLVQVNNPNVEVIAASGHLLAEDPSQRGILAATFTFGKGRVLHLVGHFDNNFGLPFTSQLPDPSPRIVVALRQAIAMNFIASAFATQNDDDK
jgi:hypothetical protein